LLLRWNIIGTACKIGVKF